MSAEQHLREGNLEGALAELQAQVRRQPAEAKHRVFLFQLLAVLGQWDRAMTQLNVAADLDAGTLAMAQTYRTALQCEGFRGEVFRGQRSPLVFGQPERWIALLINALAPLAREDYIRFQQIREEAFEAAPAVAGTIDGQPFEWIADADLRLGPVLEAIITGRYYWVPFHRVKTIRLGKPEDLRDLVWTPAQFTWANGGEAVGLIPTRYAGSEDAEDPQIRLGRKTLWLEREADTFFGLGQRLLATNQGEYPLMDIRLISLETVEEATETATANGAVDREAEVPDA